MGRKTYSGGAADTTLNGAITSTATTLVLTDGSSYPSPSVAAPMVIVIGPGTAVEEQVLISSRSGNTLSVAASGRNYHLGGSGTGVAHDNGETVKHVLDYQTIDEANDHVNTTTRDDHTQYLNATRHDVEARHAFGSALGTPGTPVAVGTGAASAGTGDDAAREDHVHNHNPPACRVYNSANISIPNAAVTALTFNSERHDTDTMHDTATNTGRITFTTAGLYVVTAHMVWAANATGRRICDIRLNGATTIARDEAPSGVPGERGHSVPTAYKFVAGDYIEITAFQDSGAALNVNAAGNFTPEFSATWLGTG